MHSFDDKGFESLRGVRGDVAPVSAEALNRGRAALLERAAGSLAKTAPVAQRPKRARWAMLGTAIAAATAGALVIGNVTGVWTSGSGATAEAAEVLKSAAVSVMGQEDVVVGDGEYLLVTTESEYMTSGATDESNPADTGYFIAYPERSDIYVPHDTDEQAVAVRTFGAATRFYGDGAIAAAEAMPVAPAETVRGVAGKLTNVLGAKEISALPRDGASLLEHVTDEYEGGSNSLAEDQFIRIADLLRSGNAPAGLRAAAYEALILIDGVSVMQDVANLNGASGVAIGLRETNRPYRSEVIVDPSSGVVIGEREVAVEAFGAVPAGAVWSWSAVTVSVVGEAP